MGRAKVGPFALNKQLLSDLIYERKAYEFNFSKFWKFVKNEFEGKESDTQILWHVNQSACGFRIITEVPFKKKDMIFVNNESSNDKKRYNRLWNGGTGIESFKFYKGEEQIEEIEAKHIWCEFGQYDKE